MGLHSEGECSIPRVGSLIPAWWVKLGEGIPIRCRILAAEPSP